MKLPVYFSRQHLRNCRQFTIVLTTACYVYSGSWLVIEVLNHFHTTFEEWSRGNLWLLILIFFFGLVVGIVRFWRKCKKMLSGTHKLKDHDISIEIRVGDIFEVKGAFIISADTAFDTDMSDGAIPPESLQGQFTNEYYDKVEYLKQELTEALIAEESISNEDEPAKKDKYEIGKVAKISPREQVAYFVAIDEFSESGGVESSLDNVGKALGSLWGYIGKQRTLEPLVIPVLGTGHSGIPISREQMITEIIKSFITACTQRKFCEKLTIIISENDYRQHDINLEELGTYIRFEARRILQKTHDLTIPPMDKPV